MSLTEHRCDNKYMMLGLGVGVLRGHSHSQCPILTGNTLEVILSTSSPLYVGLNVVAAELILLDVMIADELRSDGDD